MYLKENFKQYDEMISPRLLNKSRYWLFHPNRQTTLALNMLISCSLFLKSTGLWIMAKMRQVKDGFKRWKSSLCQSIYMTFNYSEIH